MTLRVAAALTLVLGAVGLFGYLHVLGMGPMQSPEARHLRAMKDRIEAPADATPVGFAAIESLPGHRSLADYAPLERRGVAIEGYVQYMLRATDGDIHLELEERLPPPGSRDHSYVTAEITPRWTRDHPGWRYERLLSTFLPDNGGNVTTWGRAPRRVRLTGWLLYDWQYDPGLLPGRGPAPDNRARDDGSARRRRVSAWELHPVTRIEAWDDSLAAFVEVAR